MRVIGIFSVQPSEMGRSGDGSVTDVEGIGIDRGAANDSEPSTLLASGLGIVPGVGIDSRGIGSSSLAECIERLSDAFGFTAPAACASEGAAEYYRTQTDTSSRLPTKTAWCSQSLQAQIGCNLACADSLAPES